MEEKSISVIVAANIREIIKAAKESKIQKEDIVNIFPFEGQVYLIYYK